jgi:hypothetical protein
MGPLKRLVFALAAMAFVLGAGNAGVSGAGSGDNRSLVSLTATIAQECSSAALASNRRPRTRARSG